MPIILGYQHMVVSRFLWASCQLLIVFGLTGIEVAAGAQMFCRRWIRFSGSEFIGLAAWGALFFQPLLIAIAMKAGVLHPLLPTAVSFLFGIILLVIIKIYHLAWPIPAFKSLASAKLAVPLTAMAIYLAVVTAIVTAYGALPDYDPYTWLTFSREYTVQNFTTHISRPLFYAFIYLISVVPGIEDLPALKYIMPFFSLLALPPLWLIARRFTHPVTQLVILLVPFFSPSLVIYFTTPIPQQLTLIAAVFVLSFLILAVQSKNAYWHYLAGVTCLLAYLYHEAFLFLFLPWLMVTLAYHIPRLWLQFRRHPVRGLLLAVLSLPYLGYLQQPWEFFKFWLIFMWHNRGQTNWLFPAVYMNVDAQNVGWGTPLGVLQYYLFFVGPPVLFILAVASLQYWRSKKLRLDLARAARHSPSLMVILVIFLIFFAIAEIVPRAMNMAFLPDRSWLFAGIFSAYFFIALASKNWRHLPVTMLLFIFISIGAALLVNKKKAYLIPPAHLQAAQWIARELPAGRLFITPNQHANLLTFHAHSPVLVVAPEVYCRPDITQEEIVKNILAQDPVPQPSRDILIRQYLQEVEGYLKTTNEISVNPLIALARQFSANLQTPPAVADGEKEMYIFFAAADDRNPYSFRPYVKERSATTCPQPELDRYPDRFQEVYNDQGKVRIWKILP